MANDISAVLPLQVGQKLIIPAAAHSEAAAGKLIRYLVHGNDTVASIADEYDVSVTELRKWNGLRSNHVSKGVRLKIYPGGMAPVPQSASRERSPPFAAAVPHAVSTRSPGLHSRPRPLAPHSKAAAPLSSTPPPSHTPPA